MRRGAQYFFVSGLLVLAGCEAAAPRHQGVCAARTCHPSAVRANLILPQNAEVIDLGEQMAARSSWPSVDRGYVVEDESRASIYSSDDQFVPEIGFRAGFYPDASAYTAWGPNYGGGGSGRGGGAQSAGYPGLGGYGPWGYPGSYYGYGYPSLPYSPYGTPGYLPPGYQRQSEATRTITIRR